MDEKKKSNVEVELETSRAVVALSREKQFYSHIIQQLEKVFVRNPHEIPTSAVGKWEGENFIKFYVNMDFFEEKVFEPFERKVAEKLLVTVIEHEILHIIFGHLALRFEDRVRASVAVDLAVNSFLKKDDFQGIGCFPEDYKLEAEKSAVWYYTHLAENEHFKKQLGEGAFGAEGILQSVVGGHSLWEEVAGDSLAQGVLKDIVQKAVELCKKDYGNIPGAILQNLEGYLEEKKPIVPWSRILRTFCATAIESNLDYTCKRESRRFGTRPGTRKEDVLNLAVIVDTSGSISDEDLLVFFNEIRWIWKNGAKVVVFEADAEVQRRYTFKGKFEGEVSGRGGTDLEPALKEVEKKFDAAIYFTDFYAPRISRRYNIPTLWVLTNDMDPSEYPYPWGRHIKIEGGQAKSG